MDGNIVDYTTTIELGGVYSHGNIQNIVDESPTTSSIIGTVNVNIVGDYTITYTVIDDASNSHTITETVKVITNPDPPTIKSVVKSGTSLTVTWDAPVDDGGRQLLSMLFCTQSLVQNRRLLGLVIFYLILMNTLLMV